MPRELLMMQNSFQWGTAEGQTLEIENAIKSNARGLKIEGQTYQNLLSETKSLSKFVYDDITGEYTLTNPTVDSWNSMSINYTRPIQAGEKLLIRLNIVKNTIVTTTEPPIKITWSDPSYGYTGHINVKSGVDGLFEWYCDGASVNESFCGKIEISTRNYSSGELVIKDIQVIPVSENPLSYTDKTKEYVSTKSEFNYLYILENLKANTTYTLSYEIKSSNKITTNDKTTLFRIEKVTPDSNTIVKDGFTGTVDNIYRKHNLTFDTESNTKQIKINLRNQFNASSIGLAENTLSVRNLVLLEGDYTNRTMITELPTLIDGIESVAERESKNLLENVKWHDGWIEVLTGAFESTHPPYYNAKYSDLISIDVNNNYYFSLASNNNENVYRIRPYDADGNYVTPIDDTGNPILGNSLDIFYTYRGFFANVKYIRILLLDPTGYPPLDSLIFSQNLYNLYTEGDLNVKGKYAWMNTRKTINCKPNTNYTFSCNIESVNKGDYNANPFVEVYTNEKIYENRNVRLNEPGSVSFTTNNEAKQLIIYFFVNNETYSSTECEANFKDIVIYESNLYPIKIAQSNNETDGITLPNGVKNSIENGVHIKRIGKYIITGNEAFTLRYENDSMFTIECRDLSIEIAFNDYWNCHSKMICDKAVCENCVATTFISDKLTTCSRTPSLKGFIIAIPKSLLTEYTIDKAKEYIKSLGGMTVYYELGTPITEPLTPTEISLPQPLRSLPNGVCDEVVGNKLIQRIGEYTYNGNETIQLESSVVELIRFKILFNDYKPNLELIRRPILSDKFTSATTSQHYVGLSFSYNGGIFIYLQQTIDTLAACKQWLLENKPTFYYELETPIVHDLTIPNIHTEKGTNIITTANNIKPNMSMKAKVKK